MIDDCETCDGRGVVTDNQDKEFPCPKCDGTGEVTPLKITEPGVYDLPVEVYHSDPVEGGSLSSTGARLLLPPNCPAIFQHRQNNPVFKDDFDIGHAAHQIVLGAGPEIVVVDADAWRTNAAKEAKAKAHAEGKVPLLTKDYETVTQMAEALRANRLASALISNGRPEQTLVWRDKTSVWRRALIDWLPVIPASGRLIVTDYKTTKSAHPDKIQKSVYDFGYHQQGAWYLDGIEALGLAGPDGDAAFVFLFQEKDPPYLVTVVEMDAVALRMGRDRNRAAIEIYRQCKADDRWPGYSDEIELVGLPTWVENSYLREMAQ